MAAAKGCCMVMARIPARVFEAMLHSRRLLLLFVVLACSEQSSP
jgi:hypothetical protein